MKARGFHSSEIKIRKAPVQNERVPCVWGRKIYGCLVFFAVRNAQLCRNIEVAAEDGQQDGQEFLDSFHLFTFLAFPCITVCK